MVCQIEAKLELRLDHIERDERLNVFDREELRFNLFREVFEETALELKVKSFPKMMNKLRSCSYYRLMHSL